MPWLETGPVDQRERFIRAYYRRRRVPAAELFRQFRVAPKTGYKWIKRFLSEGLDGLKDRSRARKTMTSRTPPYPIELLIAFRRKHPTWGAKKLIAALQVMHPMVDFPAASTANEILKSHGLVREQRRRRRWVRNHAVEMRDLAGPNSTWAIDFKGHFRLRSGGWCYPLTITDLASRKIIRCTALRSTELEQCWSILESAFREFGLPCVIRSDNGTPFRAPKGELGLSAFGVRLIELGVDVEYIERGKPQQNGSHERMHRTLKAECLASVADDLVHQQVVFDSFVHEFNSERPHEALALQPPDAVYEPSRRVMPTEPPLPVYARHVETRPVDANGCIKWKGKLYSLTRALTGKTVGLEWVCDELLRVQYFNKQLAMIDVSDEAIFLNPEWWAPGNELE